MVLATKRLRLRDVVFEDWPFIFDYFKDERFYRFRAVPVPDEKYVQDEVRKYIAQQEENPRRSYNLLIENLATAEKIGLVSLRPAKAAGYQAEIGYSIHHDQLGNGFATEAAEAIIQFGKKG